MRTYMHARKKTSFRFLADFSPSETFLVPEWYKLSSEGVFAPQIALNRRINRRIQKYATVSQRQRTRIRNIQIDNLRMSNAKVMTFSEISKFSQDFLKIFFKKKKGCLHPIILRLVSLPPCYSTESAKRAHTAK